MKTKNLKISVILFAFIVSFISCNKDVPVAKQQDETSDPFVIPKDSATIVDAVLSDDTLKEYTDVMDIKGDFIKYVYSESGVLTDIYYCKSDITAVPAAEIGSVAYMVDRFTYNNSGRLEVLARYNLEAPSAVPDIKRTYIYDDSGKLVEIVTEQLSAVAPRHELLFYDNAGNMVKKLIKGSDVYYTFEYDKNNYVRKISEYKGDILNFFCLLYYDENVNIQAVEFYFPTISASSAIAYTRSAIKFEHDGNPNPFKDLKLPILSLCKWMDGISTNNYTKIINGSTEVIFKYEYNLAKYPVLRYRLQ